MRCGASLRPLGCLSSCEAKDGWQLFQPAMHACLHRVRAGPFETKVLDDCGWKFEPFEQRWEWQTHSLPVVELQRKWFWWWRWKRRSGKQYSLIPVRSKDHQLRFHCEFVHANSNMIKLLYFELSPPWHLYVLFLANLLAFYLTYLLA